MKKTLAILAASTALSVAIGLPALSALNAWDETSPMITAKPAGEPPLRLSDNDEKKRGSWLFGRHGHDDDDDDDDDDEGGNRGANNPAPAGTVAPPQNGLFGNGAPPKVQVN